ncbi:sensor histidine kinase [Hufsiella ginkgonis]|uniref:histidine kinase n=1 Tax=Hufsiella ginkgonis TaxID=2695274 RepID=A0A7K1XS32_9SPHI|nr:ATP-binding protein [Hufsiella ginkgonis]MXV13795.1 hypothetical protein [Hufsiella ginkgonis]
MLRRCIEYFIPKQLEPDSEYMRRAGLIAYTVFITAIFSLFYVSVSWITGFFMGMVIMMCCFLLNACLLLLLKWGVNLLKVANAYGFIGATAVYGCIYFSGGFKSPILPWLASSPIVILLIAGKKSGYVWTGIALLIVAALGIMDYNGFQFPHGYSRSKEFFLFFSGHLGLVLIIFFIALIFENARIKAFKEVSKQKDSLQVMLSELKSAQDQLIQSEKMASLGELTAGIAHEIQNPLNFVNNFAEVNIEMVAELEEELKSGNIEESLSLVSAIGGNEQKISHHGKRADFIIKGMLQHSRTSTGERRPTNVNILADEFLKLSYHGLRAKDNSFNAEMVTRFDPDLPKVNVVQQDIGRVLLNLFNNGFYAVREKQKNTGEDYKPVIEVSTSARSSFVEITVQDNGNGIPDAIKDKIMQPFFTTKPTGEGTGLGLSLSYDIIVKGHNGSINMASALGEYTRFTIRLPLKE